MKIPQPKNLYCVFWDKNSGEKMIITPMLQATIERIPPHARLWIYQSDRNFTPHELVLIKGQLDTFTRQWVSHDHRLKAGAEILYDRFIILWVDETTACASGCSVDSSVRFLRFVEKEFNVNLFDRTTFAWINSDGQVHTASQEEFPHLYQQGLIDDQTLVFDNLVKNGADWKNAWLKPLHQSWHKRFV